MATARMISYPAHEGLASYPPHHNIYQARALQHQVAPALSMHSNVYAGFTPTQQPTHPSQPISRSHSSGSQVSDDGAKPSLPSISNLLGIADGDRPSHDTAPQHEQHQQTSNPQAQQHTAHVVKRMPYPVSDSITSHKNVMPPTPPLRNDSVVQGTNSPPALSNGSVLPGPPYFLGSSINNIEADHQRVAQVQFIKRHSVPSQPNTSPYGQSPYTTSPYTNSPGGLSSASYYSPTDPSYSVNALYHQRPLPSNFPPQAPMPVQQPMPSFPAMEHHHYISPSAQATFPQSPDRYICPTCNKAFSRPSSLKIHSHSHTGEKPFKCPHAGCGKAFSVRSNMKRHERGCHSGVGGDVAGH